MAASEIGARSGAASSPGSARPRAAARRGGAALSAGAFGSSATLLSAAAAMGCCAGWLAPVASVAAALPFLSSETQLPFLYAAVASTLAGLALAARASGFLPLGIGFLGAAFLLVPFHFAMDATWFRFLVGSGLSLLVLASWGPFLRRLWQRARSG